MTPGAAKQRSLLRNRDFMILWSGQIISELGLSMSFFVFPLVGYALTGSSAQPAETAAIRQVVPKEQLPDAISQNQARQHIATLVGPPLSGVLYSVARWLPFLANMITFAISTIALLFIRTPLPAPPRPEIKRGLWTEIVEGIRFLLSRSFFRAVLAFATLVNFAAGALFTALTLKLLQAGAHPAAIGTIDAIGGIAGIFGAVLAPRLMRRFPTGPLVIVGGALLVTATIPMAFTNNVFMIGGLLGLGMVGLPVCNAALFSYLITVTPDGLQGRANAGLNFVATVAQPAGPIVGGTLLALLGGRWAMLAMALLMGLAIIPLALNKAVRGLSTPDTWPTAESVGDHADHEPGEHPTAVPESSGDKMDS